uniref:RRM domain-containing protein n=1 Tax=Macrostomum lignano TaxID=282301 RepID=A0A1I8JN65_9PLAT
TKTKIEIESRSRSRDRGGGSSSRHHHESKQQQASESRPRRSRQAQQPAEQVAGSIPHSANQRKPYKYWDVPPPGFENITPMQYKAMQASGQIPTNIYAAGQVPMPDNVPNAPLVLQTNLPFAGSAVSRQARRLYIGNIPFGVSEEQMMDFFNEQINLDKNFAFLEFRSVDETTQALALDGINFMGQSLKIRRPRDYVPLPGLQDNPSVVVPEWSTLWCPTRRIKCLWAACPTICMRTRREAFTAHAVSTSQARGYVKELLLSFGPLRAFKSSKGHGLRPQQRLRVRRVLDPSITDAACAGLNGMPTGR